MQSKNSETDSKIIDNMLERVMYDIWCDVGVLQVQSIDYKEYIDKLANAMKVLKS